jgi:hypothetical protein
MQTQLTISLSKIKLLLFIFFIQNTFSQTVEKNVMLDEKVKNYFNLTRENIHLHFNKETYINNETIWFKGYVIDKASGILNIETTNVYVSLLDKEKKVIDTKLVLCNFGTFSGHWDLDKDLTSGYYYIHAFTNFMNNFKENESSLFKIKILNPKESEVIENIDILTNATIEIAAEGGNFIFECDNRIGVTIKDCNGKGIKQENIKVVDSKNNIINQFATNSEGYGAFYILNTKNEAYKILVENKYAKIEKNLPPVQIEGVTISTSNSINADQLLIEIKTNKNTLSKIKNKKFHLIFQKNQLLNKSEITINEKVKKISISKDSLLDGVNYIKLIDEKNNLVAERIIYNHLKNKNNLKITKLKIENDTIIFKGKIENKLGTLSISALPSETINSFENNAITSQLKVNNYLLNDLNSYSYYFKNFDRNKSYELDLFMLSQKQSKYKWQNFLNLNPIDKYEFQKGLNVKVTLNQNLPKKSNTNYTGNLIILEENTILQEELENTNVFNFKNVIVRDSTNVVFTLNANDENFNKQVNSVARVINSFTRVKIPETNHCVPSTYIKRDYQNLDFPQNNKTIILKNIEVSKNRNELQFDKTPRNKLARGIKIDPEKEHLSLLQFLQKNGYNITNTPNLVRVQNVGMRRANGDASEPVIFIDDFPINDLTFLREYNSSDVDEIYFNKFDNSNQTIKGELGTIRIYLRRELNLDKIKPKGLKVNTITNGFQAEKPFLNPYDSNFKSDAFKKHGTLYWIPNIYTDNEGNFEFKIPILEQEKILLNIQGIDIDGNLYYENITVNVTEKL